MNRAVGLALAMVIALSVVAAATDVPALWDDEVTIEVEYARAMTDLEAVWDAVHDNTPNGWYVGRP